MKRISLIAFLALIVIPLQLYSSPMFNPVTGHWYDIVLGNWLDAEAAAVALGGHLVTIDNQQEQDWLVSTFGGYEHFWIGANDIATEGDWVWSSGDPWSYTNWNSGEPNDFGAGEDYGLMNFVGIGEWNDLGEQNPYWDERLGIAEYTSKPERSLYYNPDTGHYYEVVLGGWLDAEAAAMASGGHLVTIGNQQEQDWLVSTFGGYASFFIGANDIATEGAWAWSSGEPWGYTNWASGEPNDFGAGEDYGVMNWTRVGGDWNDVGPQRPYTTLGIAEYTSVPEPSTIILLGTGLLGLFGYARRRAR